MSEFTWASAVTDGRGLPAGPRVFVQWKGTDVCLDLFCVCGHHGHYDGDFAYGLRCPECDQTWIMPHTFGVIPGEYDDVVTQDAVQPTHQAEDS